MAKRSSQAANLFEPKFDQLSKMPSFWDDARERCLGTVRVQPSAKSEVEARCLPGRRVRQAGLQIGGERA